MADAPNVLLITVDHWYGSLLGAASHPVAITPTLDELARSGVRFTRAYSECPVCIPARRTLMTGTSPRTHGDRQFQATLPMPDLPTLAQTFREHGYQATAVGKLHVYPQRDRIGFDDAILMEEGRIQWGVIDDYEAFLAERGYAGQQFIHGMGNNDYVFRPWHLPEDCHPTAWLSTQMARTIKRRDPNRPAFWYLSYNFPHPPLVPPAEYLALYDDLDIDPPVIGAWARQEVSLPYALRARRDPSVCGDPRQIADIRRAFYAQCTYIDHQLRVVIGTLREEKILDNTIICFTADHGDMLGDHGLWAKRLMYERSANVPMILAGAAGDEQVGHHRTDNRLVGLGDVMPTLLHLAGIEVPGTVEGLPMVGEARHDLVYGECGTGLTATRMVHDGRHKLIYYPVGNRVQLFDLDQDPAEEHDRADDPAYATIRDHLIAALIQRLYDGDENWTKDGRLVGLPDQSYQPRPNRGLNQQRGLH